MDRAILSTPPAAPGTTAPGRPSGRSPYPVFFQQEAVIALQEHLKSSPTQAIFGFRSEEHTSELQSRGHLVCRLLLEKKNIRRRITIQITLSTLKLLRRT